MGDSLMVLLKRNAEALCTGSDPRVVKVVQTALAMKNPTLQSFDKTFNSQIGGPSPLFPFDKVEEYYKWASSDIALPTVRTPLLTISAADDPIVRKIPPSVDNPHVIMVTTSGGGHLGWFEAGPGWFTVKRWIQKPVIEWLRMHGEELTFEGRGEADVC